MNNNTNIYHGTFFEKKHTFFSFSFLKTYLKYLFIFTAIPRRC